MTNVLTADFDFPIDARDVIYVAGVARYSRAADLYTPTAEDKAEELRCDAIDDAREVAA
jgi:hypothetical protein